MGAREVRGVSREWSGAPWQLRHRPDQLRRARDVRAPDAVGPPQGLTNHRSGARRGLSGLPWLLRSLYHRRRKEDRRPPRRRLVAAELAWQRAGAALRLFE